MVELVALVGGQVVPAREVGARKLGGKFGASFVCLDCAEQGSVPSDAVNAEESGDDLGGDGLGGEQVIRVRITKLLQRVLLAPLACGLQTDVGTAMNLLAD
jgi:hypothetical protein